MSARARVVHGAAGCQQSEHFHQVKIKEEKNDDWDDNTATNSALRVTDYLPTISNSHVVEESHAGAFDAELSRIKRERHDKRGHQRANQTASLSISDSLPSRHYGLRPFVNTDFTGLLEPQVFSNDQECGLDLVTPISRAEIYHTIDCVAHPATNQAPRQQSKSFKVVNTGKPLCICEKCGRGFQTTLRLKKHLRTHMKRPFHCKQCKKAYKQLGDLQTHSRTHTGERPYVCSHCGKRFYRSDHLKRHVRIHTKEHPYHCRHCGKTFSDASNLSGHLRRSHNKNKNTPADAVGLASAPTPTTSHSSPAPLSSDSSTVRSSDQPDAAVLGYSASEDASPGVSHTEEDNFQEQNGAVPSSCVIIKFYSAGLGDYFQECTVGKRLYRCQYCNLWFDSTTSLKTHLQLNHQTKFACYSKYSTFFQAVGEQKRRMKLAHCVKRRTFHCFYCKKVFYRSDHLRRHHRLHTGEKPYQCRVCGKRFSDASNMKGHQRSHHQLPDNNEMHYHGEEESAMTPVSDRPPSLTPGTLDASLSSNLYNAGSNVNDQPCSDESQKENGSASADPPQLVLVNTEEILYKCERCSKSFTNTNALEYHVLYDKHTPFPCHKCNKSFLVINSYMNHSCLMTAKKRSRICSYCGKGFARADNLTRHIRLHTGEKPFQCSYCGKKYADPSALKQHVTQHQKKDQSIVEEANEVNTRPATSSTASESAVHCNTELRNTLMNTGESGLTNPDNNLSSLSDSSNNAPESVSENREQLFEPSYDPSKFVLTKLGKRTYGCDRCSKSFSTTSILKSHLLSHRQPIPYPCRNCNRSFTPFNKFLSHRCRVKKSRECNHCRKVFCSGYALRRHLRLHTGEKPFECNHCGKRFADASNLRGHRESHMRKQRGTNYVNTDNKSSTASKEGAENEPSATMEQNQVTTDTAVSESNECTETSEMSITSHVVNEDISSADQDKGQTGSDAISSGANEARESGEDEARESEDNAARESGENEARGSGENKVRESSENEAMESASVNPTKSDLSGRSDSSNTLLGSELSVGSFRSNNTGSVEGALDQRDNSISSSADNQTGPSDSVVPVVSKVNVCSVVNHKCSSVSENDVPAIVNEDINAEPQNQEQTPGKCSLVHPNIFLTSTNSPATDYNEYRLVCTVLASAKYQREGVEVRTSNNTQSCESLIFPLVFMNI